MLVVNLFFIKKTNGLFHYAIDYIHALKNDIRQVIVNPSLERAAREIIPQAKIIVCYNLYDYIKVLINVIARHDFIFTPSSHPIPFIPNQLIVLHDSYPFEHGFAAHAKRITLQVLLLLSWCKVGFINQCEAKPFLIGLGVDPARMIFLPNKFPDHIPNRKNYLSTDGRKTVGLMGTDSVKKNYDKLFRAVRKYGLSDGLTFNIYGHETDYLSNILSSFPDITVNLIKSDETSLLEFINSIDFVASAAEQEGFGRPIATALLAGLPVLLLDRPVFKEFFFGGAFFYTDIDSLVQSFNQKFPAYYARSFRPPSNVVSGFFFGLEELRRYGTTLRF